MRGNAAIWVFCLAMTGGIVLHVRKISDDDSETATIHRELRKLVPRLIPGQQLSLMTDAEEGPRLIHARLALAPCNLFLAKAADKPDTVLTIARGYLSTFDRSAYVEIGNSSARSLDFRLFARRQ